MRCRPLVWLLPLVTGIAAASCAVGGDSTLTNPPQTQQPPAVGGGVGAGGAFNPGDGGPTGSGANGYGANGSGAAGPGAGGAGGAGMADAGPDEPLPPMCGDDLKRCDHVFTLAYNGESAAELRGDFAPGAWMMGIPMTHAGSSWTVTTPLPYGKEVQYQYYVNGSTYELDPANPDTVPNGLGGKNSHLAAMTCASFTCASPPLVGTFDWRDAVLYFVFVDRFLDGNPANNGQPTAIPGGGTVDRAADYQGGDWAGVLQKINEGYFNDLGVNVLWLTTPADNTDAAGLGTNGDTHWYSGYHGYWPSNLDAPEEHFGAMADLKAVVDAAHGKKLKVILDYVMNHVYQDSPTYAQHKDWFWPVNLDSGKSCICGTSDCDWNDPVQSKRCWFTDYLPTLNFQNADARAYSVSNAVTWAKSVGADGFRLDAVKQIEESWITDVRAKVTSDIESTTKEHFYMVGETFTGVQDTIRHYVDPLTKLDGQFDFPQRVQIARTLLMRQGSMKDLEGFLNQNDTYYDPGIMSTFIGNQDMPRAIHFADDTPLWGDPWSGGKDRNWSNQPTLPAGMAPFERVASAFALLMTTRGVPLIYYGDEIGLPGAGDPDNRRMMQWDTYSPGQTFLRDQIKKLTAIRAAHPAARRGARSTLSVSSDLFVYKMSVAGDALYVAINRGDSDAQASAVPAGMDLLTGAMLQAGSANVPARSAVIVAGP